MLLRRSGVLVITGLPSLEAWEGGKPQRQPVSHDTVAMALGCWRNWCSDVDGEAERESWGAVDVTEKRQREAIIQVFSPTILYSKNSTGLHMKLCAL